MSKAWKRKRQRAGSRETSRARIAAAKQPSPLILLTVVLSVFRENS